jgi:hypothetical protein
MVTNTWINTIHKIKKNNKTPLSRVRWSYSLACLLSTESVKQVTLITVKNVFCLLRVFNR